MTNDKISSLSHRIGLAFLVPASLVVAYFASKINTGAWELVRWDTHVLSNMTALYFGILVCVGGMGGYLASKQKTKRRKLTTNIVTLVIVLLLANVLGSFMPFLGYVGQ